MKFKLDENFGPSALTLFQQRGLDCHTVHQEGLTGADDPTIYAAALSEQRVLVTMDHDFGNVLHYPPQQGAGVVVINPGTPSRRLLTLLLESFLAACEKQALRGKLWIVEPGRIREHESPYDDTDQLGGETFPS